MGATASTPFPHDAVVNCCVKVVNLFGPIYVKALAIALLDEQAKAAPGGAAPPSGLVLQRPPVAKEPLEKVVQARFCVLSTYLCRDDPFFS